MKNYSKPKCLTNKNIYINSYKSPKLLNQNSKKLESENYFKNEKISQQPLNNTFFKSLYKNDCPKPKILLTKGKNKFLLSNSHQDEVNMIYKEGKSSLGKNKMSTIFKKKMSQNNIVSTSSLIERCYSEMSNNTITVCHEFPKRKDSEKTFYSKPINTEKMDKFNFSQEGNKKKKFFYQNSLGLNYINVNILSPSIKTAKSKLRTSSFIQYQKKTDENSLQLQLSKKKKKCPRIQKYIYSDKKRTNLLENREEKKKIEKKYIEHIIKSTNDDINKLEKTCNFDSNLTFADYGNKKDNQIIKEDIIYNKYAVIIQAVFRGYLARIKFDNFLYNYKEYMRAWDALKMYDLINLDYTNEESPQKYTHLLIHKEIGERFNYLKKNQENLEFNLKNKQKNILSDGNKKMSKDIKYMKTQYNNLDMENQIDMNIYLGYKLNHHNYKELLIKYSLLYLIDRKHSKLMLILRKNFAKYKSQIFKISNKIKYSNSLRNLSLINIITKIIIKVKSSSFHIIFNYYKYTILNEENMKKQILLHLLKIKQIKEKKIMDLFFNIFLKNGKLSQMTQEKMKLIDNTKKLIMNNLKQIINEIDNRLKIQNLYKIKNIFQKWHLISKILAMKAVTDEKKRKKRQKQRTKKKSEKNKSAQKYYLNTEIINNHYLKTSYSNSNISKEMNKEKDILNYLEHSSTTEFSGIDMENKANKIYKATEKLHELFSKASLKISIDYNNNKIKIKNENNKQNNKGEFDKISDEDSGESSLGI